MFPAGFNKDFYYLFPTGYFLFLLKLRRCANFILFRKEIRPDNSGRYGNTKSHPRLFL